MRNCISFLITVLLVGSITSCTTNGASSTGNSEVVLYEADLQVANTETDTVVDTLKQGPFYKQVSSYRNDDNGGYEEYRLTMNLYKEDIPNGQGELCHGTLVLYVKTPDNTEGIEVARRIISQVETAEGDTALLRMSSSEERPQIFDAMLVYNRADYTYSLEMSAPGSLEDLMENRITLQ